MTKIVQYPNRDLKRSIIFKCGALGPSKVVNGRGCPSSRRMRSSALQVRGEVLTPLDGERNKHQFGVRSKRWGAGLLRQKRGCEQHRCADATKSGRHSVGGRRHNLTPNSMRLFQ